MEKLIEYFNEYVLILYKSDNVSERKIAAHNILRIMHFVNTTKKNKYTIEFKRIYKNLLKEKDLKKIIISSESTFEYKEQDKFSIEEFNYIKDIIKYINADYEIDYKILNDLTKLKKYMGKYVYEKYMTNNDIIIDNKIDSCCLKLTDRNMVFLDKLDDAALIHELMHINVFNEKYSEFPSILAELSFCSYYKIGDSGFRLRDIDYVKTINKKMFDKCNREKYLEELVYCLGTLLSIAFIYKNGNYFKNVDDVINIIHNYQSEDIFNIMNKLNITDNDIINGFRNYKKILTK